MQNSNQESLTILPIYTFLGGKSLKTADKEKKLICNIDISHFVAEPDSYGVWNRGIVRIAPDLSLSPAEVLDALYDSLTVQCDCQFRCCGCTHVQPVIKEMPNHEFMIEIRSFPNL